MMIKTVGELKKALEPYPDDMMVTVADWEDMYHFIDTVAHPADFDPEEGVEINTSEIMVFTKDYVETVWDEMKWEILAAEDMQKQKEGGDEEL